MVLQQVKISSNNIAGLDNKVQVFDNEIPGSKRVPPAAETPKANPLVFNTPATDLQFWVEGKNLSATLRDTGFQLGINGVENDGDRVSVTVGNFTLNVQGAQQVGGTNSSNFLALIDPSQVVTLTANITPVPPPTQPVTWTGGTEVPANPLKRTVSRANITVTNPETVAASFGGLTKKANIFIARVTLDVDADRDGIVSQNEAGKNTWEFGAGKKGAIILCNCDNDDKASGNTKIDNENAVVDGTNDVSDLAPLIVRQSGILPPGISLVLSVVDRDKIRIFNQRSASATTIIGPGTAFTAEATISNTQNADVELGMEATQYPNTAFNGLIQLALTLKDGTTEITKDNVKVKVAPWIMPSHLNETEELYIVEIAPGSIVFNDPLNAPSYASCPKGNPINIGNAAFVFEINSIATDPAVNIPLKRASGATYGGDRWMQDTMEIGYSRMPGKQIPVALRAHRNKAPRLRLQPFAKNELLNQDYGFVEVFTTDDPTTFDSNGNLEVSPPVTVGGKEYKLGRIYYGPGRLPFEPFNSKVEEFLIAQEVQKPFKVDTSWLAVGHVDEIISFVQSNTGKPFRMLFASTTEATRILKDLKNAGHGNLSLFTGKPRNDYCPFHERTIDQLLTELNDISVGKLGWANNICQTRLDAVAQTIKTELGLDLTKDVIKIPVSVY